MLAQALADLEESPEQRKARMQARALELKEKREGERLSYVQQQYERQWRLACDPLREQDSKLIVKATNAARAFQIGEKMRQLETEEQENRAFDSMWEADRLAKVGREEADAAARKSMDELHKAVLDRQVGELHDYRESEKALASEEAAMMRQQCDLERAEAKRVEDLRRQMILQANDELHAFNRTRRSQIESSSALEVEADKERLAAQLAKERDAEQRETSAKQAMQAETRLFAEHMLAQKREANLQEQVQEEIRAKELDKAWDKRLTVWGREQEARERLMAQVLDERKLQVMTKLEQEEFAKNKSAADRATLEVELARVTALENAKQLAARQTRMDHRSLLEAQIKEKTFKKAAADYTKLQERFTAERAEAHYQSMLDTQMAKTQSQMNKYA